MKFYKIEAVLALHQLNVERFGGSLGIRDQGALESALNAPIDRAYHGQSDAIGCERLTVSTCVRRTHLLMATSELRRQLALVFCALMVSIRNPRLTKCAMFFLKSLRVKQTATNSKRFYANAPRRFEHPRRPRT